MTRTLDCRRMPAYNSTYQKVTAQWLNKALRFYQRFCFGDSAVLLNRHLRVSEQTVMCYCKKRQ